MAAKKKTPPNASGSKKNQVTSKNYETGLVSPGMARGLPRRAGGSQGKLFTATDKKGNVSGRGVVRSTKKK